MKSSLTIPISIVVGGIIIALAVYISLPKDAVIPIQASLIRPVEARDHILGNPAAQAMVIEYSDFDCEYCKHFHSTLHQIIANEGIDGDIAWVFRHFPLYERHPNALLHARAAECAGKVGGNTAFWSFADALFESQPADPTRYGEFARAAGLLSTTDFANCYANASTTVLEKISADRQNALDMGADGTPFSVILIPGKEPIVMDGAYSYDAVREIVEQALAD
jgi:protein-disulfide isomerase